MYQRGRYSEEEQTIQCTKGVGIQKQDKQYNAQNKKDKGTHDDLQNTTQDTKDFALHEHHKKTGVPENRNKLKYQYITSHIVQYK